MEEKEDFAVQLQAALNKKSEWFNTVRLKDLVEQYRILQACVKNLYDMLVKKSLIIPDPYRLDKKISEISVPEKTAFSETDAPTVLGSRFSEYEVMLDYICTYYRFTIEGMNISTIKKLLEFNDAFDWGNLSQNSPYPNTRALAVALAGAKANAPSVIISMTADNTDKCGEAVSEISRILKELGSFQKELYKAELRNDLCGHPEFNKEKASESTEAEIEEIKRLYKKVMGNKPFYTDLINEIVQEDLGHDRDARRAAILQALQIKDDKQNTVARKVEKVDLHELLVSTVLAISATAPTLTELNNKLKINFDLLYTKKKSFFVLLAAAFRKLFNLKEEEKICTINITDSRTGSVRKEKIKVNEFMVNLAKKEHLYMAIAQQGVEYSKICALPEDDLLIYINKQISELQSFFSATNALDAYFKTAVSSHLRSKVKGMQIELTALRNSIINANKKRGEYISEKEENEQMIKLGINEQKK